MRFHSSSRSLRGTIHRYLLATGFFLLLSCWNDGGSQGQPQLTGITISTDITSLSVGQSIQLSATGTFSNNETRDVTGEATWSSSDTSIATISNQTEHPGLLTAIAPGEVIIKAAFEGCETEKAVTIQLATWIKSFGGSENVESESVIETSEGDFLVTGRIMREDGNWDVCLMRIDSLGNPIWEKAYGGTGDDTGKSVVEVDGGKYVVAGQVTLPDGTTDICLLCVDQNGEISWEENYGGPDADEAGRIQHTFDGNLLVAGSTQIREETKDSLTRSGDGPHWDVYLLKVDTDGNLIWERTWGERSDETGPFNEKARSVTEVADGGFIMTGTTDHTETILAGTEEDSLLLLRVDENGAAVWQKSFSGGPFVIRRGIDVLEAQEGGLMVLEQTIATAPADGLCRVMKTDRSGDVEWSRIYKSGGGRWSGFGLAMAEAVDDSGYVIAGYDYCDHLDGVMGIDLLKIDHSGESQWYKCYVKGMGVSVQKTRDGGYVVLGNSDTGFNTKSVMLIKTDDTGETYGE